ncbi:MAG TPA: 3-deoxy-manno-octulosonate cytidylyltransferase, partial [Saprospiraceae bacterium]|nr:3-deoxy-manno-octulosonate cytidylyltransferase [Saprospiraceae bacterium]
ARYASTRLPAKPLIQIRGKSIIQRVCERVTQAKAIDHFCVATDDILIYNHVKKLGYDVLMTRYDQPSGTYRCAEVLGQFPMVTHVINVQGDEPLIDPIMIDQMALHMIEQSGMKIGTLVRRIDHPDELLSPHIVKVVINKAGEAMYFSRQPIPFVRDVPVDQWLSHGPFYKHIGMYGYTAQALLAIEKLSGHPYEQMEKLEQLTWLANGLTIQCLETNLESKGIDTEEDLRIVAAMIDEAEN